MDFFRIKQASPSKDKTVLYPDFKVGRSKDLMIRGKDFYAIWDEDKNLWSTDEYDVQRIVDSELSKHYDKVKTKINGTLSIDYMASFGSGSWRSFKNFLKNLSDNVTPLDETLVFSNTELTKNSFASKRLSYPLEKGSISAYDELIGTLYTKYEREKIEWAIGSIVSGDSKNIQKFLVLYGDPGSGKGTILNLISKLFEGYWTSFDAKELTAGNNQFAVEVFKSNPLVAIQHDGDLSRIEDNTKLNSIVSHEYMTMNEKYKSAYTARVNCFLFLGSNKAVRITDAKAGIIRRLIDVTPSGVKIAPKKYDALVAQADFELGAIAYHCLNVYRKLGRNYYATYKPLSMIMQTDVFFNFVENHYFEFLEENGTTLKRAYDMYKLYCEESLVEYKLPRHRFREELKSYFKSFDDIIRIDGKQIRSYYSDFITDKFKNLEVEPEEDHLSLILDSDTSIFDALGSEYEAQYTTKNETPLQAWDEVKTTLKDIDTSKLHYVKPPLNHIVIDFDIKNDSGEKDMGLNLEAANKWPRTYAELSKGGQGIHLHYIYDGDAERLNRIFAQDIEVKVFTGKSSLRRRLSKCNNIPVATINSGLPVKGEKMIDFDVVRSENKLRTMIQRNIMKEFHAGTKPSIDFIHKILEDAYESGLKYDVSDMQQDVLVFATSSTNQASYCLRLLGSMKFKSDHEVDTYRDRSAIVDTSELVFYDIEVYPNLLLVVWQRGLNGSKVRMVNPSAAEVESLVSMPLVGFNNRRYDNHILYGAMIGYNNEQIYNLSQGLIGNSKSATFREAYGMSYIDIYEYASKKQGLKKWEIELGIQHMEWELPWDQPIADDMLEKVCEYCENDVDATVATFLATAQDYDARKILSELSGLPMNSTTQNHAARIVFGRDKNPQQHFEYTDLSGQFPGYKYDYGKSTYRGEEVGEGGYVYSEPGMYTNVALMDIESQHPRSAILMDIFGKYTVHFKELVDARLAIKHRDLEAAGKMLSGILKPYLSGDAQTLSDLSYALKIVINIVYGMSSAKFDNPFKDPRNIDNIVAKRGALFMIDLKHAVQEKGFTVAHIKTDSIKIPDATEEILDFVKQFGKKNGYAFDHEDTYPKMCLVNKAVYIAQAHDRDGKLYWRPTGTQFRDPYVYKSLFSKEKITFDDLKETKQVKTSIYLDYNENLEDVRAEEKELAAREYNELLDPNAIIPKKPRALSPKFENVSTPTIRKRIRDNHEYVHVGKIGQFTPMISGINAGLLVRESGGKYHSVTDTKKHRWMLSSMVEELNMIDKVDMNYYNNALSVAVDTLAEFGDVEWFTEEIRN